MIILRLRGGLGNQLFQYAAGKALASKHNTSLKLDLYSHSIHQYRKFELDNFKVQYELATKEEIQSFVGRFKLQRLCNKLYDYAFSKKAYAQPHYHFDEQFHQLPEDIYISGYWQSERYFKQIEKEIRTDFQLSSAPNKQNQQLIEEISKVNAVGLHVRMGDYLSKEKYKSFFGGLDMSYYKNAIECINEKVSTPVFYIFSDNIEWCKKEFDYLQNAVFVDSNSGDQSYMDLMLMSKCKHNIIANSTFSWWGAWLNEHPKKIVIAPKKWFQADYNKKSVYKSSFYNTKDLIPENWLKL